MSKRLGDQIIEEAGRRIYESQQERLLDQTSFGARRAWRSNDVPQCFWDSYCEDARAALSLVGVRISTEKIIRGPDLRDLLIKVNRKRRRL